MFIEERHQAILDLLNEKGSITTTEIQEKFAVSYDSAKRDLRILEEKGLAEKKVVDGSLYRGLWVLTDEGKSAAEQVRLRAQRVAEIAGKDLTDETRAAFYQALESISENLAELCKNGIPE